MSAPTPNLTMNQEAEFTWAPLVPLIGGFPVGIENAFGKPPELIASYDGIANDEHYINYQRKTLGREHIEYKTYDPEDATFERKINVIVCTPPCAALSSLNTSSNPEKSGSTGEQNQAMYNCVFTAAKKFDADVIMIENAPALSTNKGRPVADKLQEIGEELGYTLSLYKTSTHFHGVPQRRDRTFACFFKGDKNPVLDYQKLPYKELSEYLETMEHNVVNEDTIINHNLLSNDVYYNFLKEKYGDVRKYCIDKGIITCLQAVHKTGHSEEVYKWARDSGNEKWIKLVDHYKKKADMGKGVWDGSVHIFDAHMNAVIGRNMVDTLHPTEERSLTYLEAMYLMGLPENFELLGGKKALNHISQNVPSCTAKFMGEQAIKFLKGELGTHDSPYIKQDNWKGSIEVRREPKNEASLESLM